MSQNTRFSLCTKRLLDCVPIPEAGIKEVTEEKKSLREVRMRGTEIRGIVQLKCSVSYKSPENTQGSLDSREELGKFDEERESEKGREKGDI
jgi:hypothetical protein